jgi:RNA polymerase sigma factor (sigma-70 family)
MLELQELGGTRRPRESDTHASLLGRLRLAPDDSGLWSEFVKLYGGTIFRRCRNWGLQQADAEDVTQEVFLRLAVRMRSFLYDPRRSFRAWLKTVAQHERQHYVTKQRKAGRASGGESDSQSLSAIEARTDPVRRLQDTFDQELLHQAAERVRLRVNPKTWGAFQLLAVQGCRGAEVASRLGMNVSTAFVARSRVQRMLREEVTRSEDE